MGVALGESGLGHRLRGRRAGARPRLRGARADPGRGRADHQLGRDPARRCGWGCRWPRSASRSRSRSSRVGAHYLLGLPWELAILLGAVTLADRRRRGLLGAAGGAAAAPPDRLARGGVGPQRRPDGRPGHADLHRRRGRPRRPGDRGRSSLGELAPASRSAWRSASAAPGSMRRAALPSSGSLPARRAHPHAARLRRRRPPCTPAASRPSTSPRWCSATPTCRTAARPARSPRASPGSPRSGCS